MKFTLRKRYVLYIVFVYLLMNYLFLLFMVKRVSADIPDHIILNAFTLNEIILPNKENIQLKAWWGGGSKSSAVVLISGIRGNRMQQQTRAKFYLQNGYNVLIPDLRGTGESGGKYISFGWEERKDVIACFDFLRKRGYDTILLHGQSLGAAAIVYALNEDIYPQSIVLESCYDKMQNAMDNRLKARCIPPVLLKPSQLFGKWLYDLDMEKLQPISFLKYYKSPLFMMAGDAEIQLKKEETKALFQHAPQGSELYWFQHAGHQDFFEFDSNAYCNALSNWYQKRCLFK